MCLLQVLGIMSKYYPLYGLAAFLTITIDIVFEVFVGVTLSPLAILGVILISLVLSYIWITE